MQEIIIEKTTEPIRDAELAAGAESCGEATETYVMTQIDGMQRRVENCEQGEMLWLVDSKRAGIVWGGDPVWTDADSPADALRRWREDDLIV